MKKLMFFVILLLPFSQAILYADNLTLDLSVSNELSFVGNNPYVSEATMKFSWYPREDYRQEILSGPKDTTFTFKNPKEDVRVDLDYRLFTNGNPKKVFEKITFPIEIDEELEAYIQPQEYIDINEDIENLANELAAGKDDLYDVVFTFATWVEENIEYDLNTLSADATQKSSWVYDNGYGVCDELTSLFISLNRAVGIPARFVSGLSYSDLEVFDEDWGPHGWAEVYFPEVGWVPFDVTYRELGYVDASHIKLNIGLDSKDHSVEYSASGKDFQLEGGELNLDVNIVKESNQKLFPAVAWIEAEKSHVYLNSFNMITLTLQNRQNYYLPLNIQLGQTQNIRNYDSRLRFALLKPGERRDIKFLVGVEDLSYGYTYTFPVNVYIDGHQLKTEFKASQEAKNFPRSVFETKEEPEKTNFVDIKCENIIILKGEDNIMNCTFTNLVSQRISTKICFDVCKGYSLLGDEQEFVNFSITSNITGTKVVRVYTNTSNQISQRIYKLKVINRPELNITAVYDNQLKLNLKGSPANNVKIEASLNNWSESWYFPSISDKNIYTYVDSIVEGNNTIIIVAEHDYGKVEESVTFEYIKPNPVVGLWDKIVAFFARFI